MATLTFNPSYSSWWSGNVTINYSVAYDASTNRTTVTFLESSLSYFGRSNYGTSSSTSITVTANDSGSSETASMSTSGYTNGGSKTFTATPSPISVTVQHSATAGSKSITINANTTIKVYASSTASTQSTVTGNGSVKETLVTLYTLSMSTGNNSSVSISRIFSKYGSNGSLSNGANIFSGDVLEITFSGTTGYSASGTLNGTRITSGYRHTVSANVAVVITETVLSYSLSITEATGVTLTVTRTSSPTQGASTGAISDGQIIYYGDVLEVNYSIDEGYDARVKLNGASITTGFSHTVIADVAIVASATIIVLETGFVFIDTGSAIEKFEIFIDTGSAIEKIKTRIDNGTALEDY